MIRINLIQPAKREAEPKAQEPLALAQKKEIYPLASFVLCGAVMGLIYWNINRHISNYTAKIAVERQEAVRLAAVQAQNETYQRQLAAINQHIQLIQTLERNRTGPQQLLGQLGAAVDKINGLYLLSVDNSKARLAIHGEADYVNGIADFVGELQGLPAFTDVQLRQVFENDIGSRINFRFDLDCLYSPPVEAPPLLAAPTGSEGRRTGR